MHVRLPGIVMIAIQDNPRGITSAQVVVGIPSFNEAQTIAVPTMQADKGLSRHFSGRSAVIINCDNHSPDGTRRVFMETPTNSPKIYISTPEGVTGKGNNLRNLFERAVALKAQAVIVIDADLASITPQWIHSLGSPLFDKSEFVTPLYVRHKYDRLVNNSVAYPLTRALYGRRVRQPVGGEFGFSGRLAQSFLEAEGWNDAVANFGIDIWMTTIAMRSRAQIIQSFVGKPKIHRARAQESSASPVFENVVETVFQLMCRYEEFWKDVKWSRPTAVFGFGAELEVPPPIKLDTQRLWDRFASGVPSLWALYAQVIQPATLGKLAEVAELPREHFEFPTALWAKVLYDFARAYKNEVAPRADLISALGPLYDGKTLSFVIETEHMNTQQVEEIIEDQCIQFEKAKPYLLERWFGR